MEHSHSTRIDLRCPECRRKFRAAVWQVVDIVERPDLAAQVREDTLLDLRCPHCQHFLGAADAAVLLYRPGLTPALVFSPATGTTAEQDREQAVELVQQLAGRLGPAWQDRWLAGGLKAVTRLFLPAFASDDPSAAIDRVVEAARADVTSGDAEAVERFQRIEAQARRAREMLDPAAEPEASHPIAAQPAPGPAGLTPERVSVLANELAAFVVAAKQLEIRSLQQGDPLALLESPDAWDRVLRHPLFGLVGQEDRFGLLNDAGLAYLQRFRSKNDTTDLDRCLEAWREGIRLAPQGAPELPTLLLNLGGALRMRHTSSAGWRISRKR